jgi:5-methylcytosine-specific restriction endonuclease McrA
MGTNILRNVFNGGLWTQARFNSFVKSALRSASQRWPPKYNTLNEACVGTKINIKTGRKAKHYKCNKCLNDFPQKDVEVNHIIPVVLTSGFDNWDGVIDRLFCESSNLEVLCKPCHDEVTKIEKEERKHAKSK